MGLMRRMIMTAAIVASVIFIHPVRADEAGMPSHYADAFLSQTPARQVAYFDGVIDTLKYLSDSGQIDSPLVDCLLSNDLPVPVLSYREIIQAEVDARTQRYEFRYSAAEAMIEGIEPICVDGEIILP